MKKIIFIFFPLLILFKANAQHTISLDYYGCFFIGEPERKSVSINYYQDKEVLKIIDDILSSVSKIKNFEIYQSGINNVIASKFQNQNILIIDPKFLEEIEKKTNDKNAKYFIIAHEIGHHLKYYSNGSPPSLWWEELDADEFAGSVFQKLKMPIITFKNIFDLIAPQQSNSQVHPEWQARMKAAINGYCQSYFQELKHKNIGTEKIDSVKIKESESELEKLLNENIYEKSIYDRNIKYKVLKGKMYKEYQHSFLQDDGEVSDNYKDTSDVVEIRKIRKIFLRWHDPGEIAFECLPLKNTWEEANSLVHIETLQNKKTADRLNINSYFDDEATIADDFVLLMKCYELIAKLQKYYETPK